MIFIYSLYILVSVNSNSIFLYAAILKSSIFFGSLISSINLSTHSSWVSAIKPVLLFITISFDPSANFVVITAKPAEAASANTNP